MIKKNKITTKCKKNGKWLFLEVKYGKEYMGQIQIRKPKKDIPKIMKALRKGLIIADKYFL